MEAAPASEPQPSLITFLFLTLFLASMEAVPASEPKPSLLTFLFLTLDFPVPLPPVPG